MSIQNAPAFPLDSKPYQNQSGLTKREYFTAAAMQGILSSMGGWPGEKDMTEIANRACDIAEETLSMLDISNPEEDATAKL